jgi:hypothetical protein
MDLSKLKPEMQVMTAVMLRTLDTLESVVETMAESKQADEMADTSRAIASIVNAESNNRYSVARQGLGLVGWLGGGWLLANTVTDLADSGGNSGSTYNFNSSDQASISGVNVASQKSTIGSDGATVRAFSNDDTNSAGASQGFGGSSVNNAANANTDAGGNPNASLGGISDEGALSF